MKAKYLVIASLLVLLSIIVYQMMRFETSIREERIVKIKVVDETRPLFQELPPDQLYEIAQTADYYFTTKGDYFQVLNSRIEKGKHVKSWEQLFLKGVNLGVAMPGYFPTEFSLTFDEYLEWFRLIGEMNANVIRTYTVLPPEFYQAFAYYNLQYNNKKLYLLQGVWCEEPETDNYFYIKADKQFKREIIDVIDVIHGNAVIEPKAGHASGTYSSDISKYVLGIILGREWEPKAVIHTNKVNEIRQFNGNFISINNGNPMEVWLGKVMDFTITYETQTYSAQRPLSFVNWLPLDPMYHPTEFIENKKVREYDNDLEQIDFRKYNATPAFVPGIFASYHVYPYYPDFIYQQKNYATAKNKAGEPDNYYAYLEELKQHNPDMPLIIAEYGLPSSRGNSHYTTLGFNQGGHSEQEQAKRSWQLTKDIYDTKCGGAIFFEWIDEWFKFNWLVMDFEQPYERRKLWHNMENPEQNFGIMAITSSNKIIDGQLSDWKEKPIGKNKAVMDFDADASYFYVAMHLPKFDVNTRKLYLAIDTYDKNKGARKLPFHKGDLERGVEFLVSIDSPGNSKIQVDAPYSVYTDIYHDYIPAYASQSGSKGNFIDEIMLSNRGRITLTGDTIAPITNNRSKLEFGNSSLPEHSNADWFWNDELKVLELRIDWHLLNVCDPSGRNVLDDKPGTPDIEYTATDGFYIFPFITDKQDNELPGEINLKNNFFTWNTWEKPSYEKRLKPIYTVFKDSFPQLLPYSGEKEIINETFTITPFNEGKPAAISIVFNEADYAQYETALPVLDKYKIKATFGVVNEWVSNSPSSIVGDNGLVLQKMGWTQINELSQHGHEIALQLLPSQLNNQPITKQTVNLKKEKSLLEHKIAAPVTTIYYNNVANTAGVINNIKNAGFLFGCEATAANYKMAGMKNAYAISAINTSLYPIKTFDSIITQGHGKWQLFQYKHLSDKNYRTNVTGRSDKNNAINTEALESQLRLLRNSNYWIAPVAAIGKYIEEKKASKIITVVHNNIIFLTVANNLGTAFDQSLTIAYSTAHHKIKVSNSAADGIYNARNGLIYFQVYPNREVTIEILDQ